MFSFRTDTIFTLNIPKENSSAKNGGVKVLFIYILSADALYLFQLSFMKISMTVLKL